MDGWDGLDGMDRVSKMSFSYLLTLCAHISCIYPLINVIKKWHQHSKCFQICDVKLGVVVTNFKITTDTFSGSKRALLKHTYMV